MGKVYGNCVVGKFMETVLWVRFMETVLWVRFMEPVLWKLCCG